MNDEIIINYYDNPNNLLYTNIKKFDKDFFVSKYKKYIEYSLNKEEIYELSLTTKDEEYNNNLDNLSFIDLYWNTQDNKCDLDLALVKWEKYNINSLINNKVNLNYSDNKNIIYIKQEESSLNKIKIYFSTWAYYNAWTLIKENFIMNNNTIDSLSWSIWSYIYEITLNENIDINLINTLTIEENKITNIYWENFESEIILIQNEDIIYKNRYRIYDSFSSFNKYIYEYKLLITSKNDCTFLMKWFDMNNKTIKLPSSKLEWNFNIDSYNSKMNISKSFKLNDIKLSNYLYKFY